MRDYELVLVLDPELNSSERKKQLTKVKKIITEAKGKVRTENDWGLKDLAYPVGKRNRGYYFFMQVQLAESGPAGLEQKMKLEKGLIRHLLVRAEKTKGVKKETGKKGGEKVN